MDYSQSAGVYTRNTLIKEGYVLLFRRSNRQPQRIIRISIVSVELSRDENEAISKIEKCD